MCNPEQSSSPELELRGSRDRCAALSHSDISDSRICQGTPNDLLFIYGQSESIFIILIKKKKLSPLGQ